MGDVLENLFSVLPVVIAILWLLRRAKGRKKQGPKTSGTAPGGKIAGRLKSQLKAMEEQLSAGDTGRPLPETSISGGSAGVQQKSRKKAAPKKTVEETPWPGSPVSTVKSVAKAASKTSERTHHVNPAADDVQRNVEESPTGDMPRTVVPGTLERLDRLSPLARGLAWSFILEPPPSLKDPGK